MATGLSKEEYLKRYLSGEPTATEPQKKKKKKKPVEGAPVKKVLQNVKIVDETPVAPESSGKAEDEEIEEGMIFEILFSRIVFQYFVPR
jgi:hypothetical protein